MDGNKLQPSCSMDRKTTEKNRRNQMKLLYSELSSLVPCTTKIDSGSLTDKLDECAKHIKKMQISLEKLRLKKEKLQAQGQGNVNIADDEQGQFMEPVLKFYRMDSALEVVLITGLDHQFTLFSKFVRVLHEEGAEVVNASFYVASDKVFHIIHSKVEEGAAGCHGASRIEERLQGLIN